MNLSTNTIRRLGKAIAVTATVAAMAVPLAQGKSTPAAKYGPLDGWAYNLIHNTAPPSTFITDHSPGQNGPLDGWANGLIHRSAASASATSPNPNGFDWGDAGVGAAGTFGLALLAAGVLLATRKRHPIAH
jgi:hypothetical protein